MAENKSGIKIRAKNTNNITTVRVVMKHQMENGFRKDKDTGEIIPAYFIQEVTCESAGKTRFSALMSGGVSANPYFSFKFNGNTGDMVKITWVDNKGATESAEVAIV